MGCRVSTFKLTHLTSRADMRVHVPLPNLAVRYEILRSCMVELMRIEMVASEELLDYMSLQAIRYMTE